MGTKSQGCPEYEEVLVYAKEDCKWKVNVLRRGGMRPMCRFTWIGIKKLRQRKEGGGRAM